MIEIIFAIRRQTVYTDSIANKNGVVYMVQIKPLYLGAAWYPEDWDETGTERDIALTALIPISSPEKHIMELPRRIRISA